MGKRKRTESAGVSHYHSIGEFVRGLLSLNTAALVKYLKSLKNKEIDYTSEIVLNFLNGRIGTNCNTLKALLRMRNDLHILASKSTSYKNKKLVLNSLRGLNIIKVLLPLALDRLDSLIRDERIPVDTQIGSTSVYAK